jgi:putative transposase
MIAAVETLALDVGVAPACDALAVPRATWYRRHRPKPDLVPRPTPARALSPVERERALSVLHSPDFVDQAPATIVATLLDRREYLCSSRTMYRLLAGEHEVRERRNQLRHPVYHRPEVLATGPNQLWSWDITCLRSAVKWQHFYLYVILDVFSRKVVAWMVADRESAELAKELIAVACAREKIDRNQLILHSDRGAPMKSKTVSQLLADLEVTRSLSRPHVSNDNPFSESHFKTLKYRQDFPPFFGSIEDAKTHVRAFFDWYNNHHRHSGIAWLTPSDVHAGRSAQVIAVRQAAMTAAYAAHPERFVRKPPVIAQLPEAVWINPPTTKELLQDSSGTTIATSLDLSYHPISEGDAASAGWSPAVASSLIEAVAVEAVALH